MKSSFQYVKGGTITSPQGFLANGMFCGIKKKRKVPDVSLILSEIPAVGAAVFTINKVKAWPVLHSEQVVRNKLHRVIVGSSGNANCVNGSRGEEAVKKIVASTASLLGVHEHEILIAQTGLIGATFPTSTVIKALPQLVSGLSHTGGHAAAQGILTTDLAAKETAVTVSMGGRKVTIGAIAKGSGMIHPNMGTMLCFVTTDVAISKSLLKTALKESVQRTFNRSSVDNDMSTNDTVFVLANGLAGNAKIIKKDKSYAVFQAALQEVCRQMAYAVVEDGEGVTHICTLRVRGAKSEGQAEKAARQVANSMLFKTMLTGSDPNWGRILAAIGASGVAFDLQQFKLSFEDAVVMQNGEVHARALPAARKVLSRKHYQIEIALGVGSAEAEFVTSDLTKRYVEINAAYC